VEWAVGKCKYYEAGPMVGGAPGSLSSLCKPVDGWSLVGALGKSWWEAAWLGGAYGC